MNTYYQPPGSHGIEAWMGETDFIISFNYEDLNKIVRAFGYLTPIGSNPPSELPYPLDEIHEKLLDTIAKRTEEVYRKTY